MCAKEDGVAWLVYTANLPRARALVDVAHLGNTDVLARPFKALRACHVGHVSAILDHVMWKGNGHGCKVAGHAPHVKGPFLRTQPHRIACVPMK